MFRLDPVYAHRSKRMVIAVFFIAVLSAVCGCAVPDVTSTLRTAEPPPFSESGTVEPPDQWWTAFGDPQLNAYVDQAFDGNFTLAAALQRLIAARALARREASDLFPDLDGVADIGRVFGPGPDPRFYTFGLDASYQVDLWGQIESRVDAERFRASATREDYHVVALTLVSEIVQTWFSLIEARAQAELVASQIATNQNGLRAQELRFGIAGLIRGADVLRQRQLVESTLEAQTIVAARIEVLEHQLAVLLGQMPQVATYDSGSDLPKLPPLPTTGLPCDLLRRRPDVRREYFSFVAADRDLAAAITSRYPRLDLTGSLLSIADRPEDIFRDWFLSISGQLVGPIIDGRERLSEIDRTSALVRQRFNEYGQTMLIAFQEVEDSLALEKYQLQRLKHLESQVELAQQATDQLREQYQIGDANYLDLLSSITAQQRLQRDTLTAQLDLLLIRVSLYLALAGGFEPTAQDSVLFEELVVDPDLQSVAPENAFPAEASIVPADSARAGQQPGEMKDVEVLPAPVERLPGTDNPPTEINIPPDIPPAIDPIDQAERENATSTQAEELSLELEQLLRTLDASLETKTNARF